MSEAGKRVLHIITNLDLAGAQKSVTSICCELQKRGWDIHLAFSSRAGHLGPVGQEPEFLTRLQASGVRAHDIHAMVHSPSPLRDMWAAWKLFSLIRQVKPALVHTHTAKAGILGRLAAWAAGVPMVHSARGWSFNSSQSTIVRRLYIMLERIAARHTKLLLAVGTGTRDEGLEHRIGKAAQYRVVRSGFERPRTDEEPEPVLPSIPDGAPIVAAIMELRDHKGPTDFLAIADFVTSAHRSAHFILVGKGPLEPVLRAEAAERCLEQRFHFLGHRQDIPALLRRISVQVLPSRYEGLPRVVVESMAAGIPNVASSLPGTRELISDGVDGFLVEPGDVNGFAKRVGQILSDQNLQSVLGSAAQQKIGEEFWMDNVVTHHEEIYLSLIG
ncbi:MAG: glycosyltransferase family 4 protein [Sphingomonadaceae bacterium]